MSHVRVKLTRGVIRERDDRAKLEFVDGSGEKVPRSQDIDVADVEVKLDHSEFAWRNCFDVPRSLHRSLRGGNAHIPACPRRQFSPRPQDSRDCVMFRPSMLLLDKQGTSVPIVTLESLGPAIIVDAEERAEREREASRCTSRRIIPGAIVGEFPGAGERERERDDLSACRAAVLAGGNAVQEREEHPRSYSGVITERCRLNCRGPRQPEADPVSRHVPVYLAPRGRIACLLDRLGDEAVAGVDSLESPSLSKCPIKTCLFILFFLVHIGNSFPDRRMKARLQEIIIHHVYA